MPDELYIKNINEDDQPVGDGDSMYEGHLKFGKITIQFAVRVTEPAEPTVTLDQGLYIPGPKFLIELIGDDGAVYRLRRIESAFFDRTLRKLMVAFHYDCRQARLARQGASSAPGKRQSQTQMPRARTIKPPRVLTIAEDDMLKGLKLSRGMTAEP